MSHPMESHTHTTGVLMDFPSRSRETEGQINRPGLVLLPLSRINTHTHTHTHGGESESKSQSKNKQEVSQFTARLVTMRKSGAVVRVSLFKLPPDIPENWSIFSSVDRHLQKTSSTASPPISPIQPDCHNTECGTLSCMFTALHFAQRDCWIFHTKHTNTNILKLGCLRFVLNFSSFLDQKRFIITSYGHENTVLI